MEYIFLFKSININFAHSLCVLVIFLYIRILWNYFKIKNSMKLFMVHVGFYDRSIGEGLYETHVNYFIAAENAKEAKTKTLSLEEFQAKSMHIDGIKEISNVQGYEVILTEGSESEQGQVISYDEAKEL